MNRRALLALVAALGCSSGAHPPVKDGATGGDASSTDADDIVTADAPPDGADEADAADLAPKPPPVSSPASRLVVPGAVTLVGHGADSCTNAPSAGTDRWCAFGRAAANGFYELWLLDVTKAAAGAAIACDGSDASCVRVSTRLFKGKRSGFAGAGFNGDTLIYGESPYSGDGDEPYVGLLSAWRPGWAAGRALTSKTGRFCVGHARAEAAYCFENLSGDGSVADVTIDLLAGSLGGAATAPLPKMDTLLLAATTDAPGAPSRVQYDLSPDGHYALWSTRATANAPETLHAQKLDAADAPITVARTVSRWAVSPDGLAWYWLAGYDYDVTGAAAGTLETAPFPDGAGPVTLAPSVGEFGVLGAKGLWLRADVSSQLGTLRFLGDRDAPAGAVTVDTKVLAVLDATHDGARFLYAKTYVPVRPGPITTVAVNRTLTDLYVGSPGSAAPCVVSDTPVALNATLAAAGGLALWGRYDTTGGEDGIEDGVATSVAKCASQPFASRVAALLPAGADAYAYADENDPASGEATLRYAHAVGDTLAAAATIQTRAAPAFAPLAPALPAVAYTVATGTAADGLYVWVEPVAAVVDGGTDSPDAGAPP
jgi:hypothetical protein